MLYVGRLGKNRMHLLQPQGFHLLWDCLGHVCLGASSLDIERENENSLSFFDFQEVVVVGSEHENSRCNEAGYI